MKTEDMDGSEDKNIGNVRNGGERNEV